MRLLLLQRTLVSERWLEASVTPDFEGKLGAVPARVSCFWFTRTPQSADTPRTLSLAAVEPTAQLLTLSF